MTESQSSQAPAWTRRWFWAGVGGLTLVGGLLRLVTAGFTNRPTGNGALHFLPGIEPIARGMFRDGFEIAVPPAPSVLASLAWNAAGGDSELAFQTLTVIAGTVLIPLTALLARRPFGHRAALLATFFMALSSHSIMYSAITEVEIVYGLFVTLGLVTVLWWRRELTRGASSLRSLGPALVTGLSFGVAIQCRPEGIALPFLAALFVAWPTDRRSLRERWVPLSVSLLGLALMAILVCLPYTLYLRDATGQWHFSGKLNAHLLEGREPYQLTPDERFTLWEYTLREEPFAAASPLESRPGAPLLGRWSRGVLRYLQNTPRYTDWVPILGLVSLGFWLCYRRRQRSPLDPPTRSAIVLLGGVLGFYYLALPVVLTTWRLFIPYLAGLFALASWGFDQSWTRAPRRLRRGFPVLLLLYAGLCLASLERRHLRDYDWAWRNSPERRLGDYLAPKLESGAPLIEYINGTVFHYADALHLIYPAANPDAFDRHCRIRGVRYVVIDSDRVNIERYPWQRGAEGTGDGENSVLSQLGFELIREEVEPGTGRRLLLFHRSD